MKKHIILILGILYTLTCNSFAANLDPAIETFSGNLLSNPIFSKDGQKVYFVRAFGMLSSEYSVWDMSKNTVEVIRREDSKFGSRYYILNAGNGYLSVSDNNAALLYPDVRSLGIKIKLSDEILRDYSWQVSGNGEWLLSPPGFGVDTVLVNGVLESTSSTAAQVTAVVNGIISQEYGQNFLAGAISNDAKFLFLTSPSKSILISTETKSILWSDVLSDYSVDVQYSFSGDGSRLISGPFKRIVDGSETYSVKITDVNSGEIIRDIETGKFTDIAVNDNADTILIGYENTDARIFYADAGIETLTLNRSKDAKKVGLSNDGSKAVVYTNNAGGAQRLLQYATAKPVKNEPEVEANQIEDYALQAEMVVRTGHSGTLVSAFVTGDGKFVISSGQEGNVWLWNASNGRAIRRLRKGRSEFTTTQQLAPTLKDGKVFFTENYNGYLLPLNGDPPQQVAHNIDGPFFMDFALEQSVLVTADLGNVTLYDAKNFEYIDEIYKRSDHSIISAADRSINGTWFAVGESEGQIALINLQSQKTMLKTQTDDGEIDAILPSNDGKFIYVAVKGLVYCIDASSQKVIWEYQNIKYPMSFTISKDGMMLAVGSTEKSITILDTSTGGIIQKPSYLYGYENSGQVKLLQFFDSDQRLLIGSVFEDINLQILDLNQDIVSHLQLTTHVSTPNFVRFSDDNAGLWLGHPGTVSFWSFENGRQTYLFTNKSRSRNSINDNGNGLLISEVDYDADKNILSFWTEREGKKELMSYPTYIFGEDGQGQFQFIEDGQFSDSGRYLVIRNSNSTYVFDTTNGQVVHNIDSQDLAQVYFSLDDEYIIFHRNYMNSGQRKSEIIVYSIYEEKITAQTGANIYASDGEIQFISDNSHILINDKYAYNPSFVLELKSGKIKKPDLNFIGEGYEFGLRQVFNTDSAEKLQIIHDRISGLTTLFNYDKRQVETEFKDFSGVEAAVMLPDGRKFLTLSQAGVVKIRDRSDGKVHYELIADVHSPERVDFSKDGQLMALAEKTGIISLWRVDNGQLLARIIETKFGQWAVVDRLGRFDSSDPGNIPVLSWRLSTDDFKIYPIEIFLREYYEPGLLGKLIAGVELPLLPPISDRDLRTPIIEIMDVENDSENTVRVSIKVAFDQSDEGKNGDFDGEKQTIRDLKLFRDGNLVRKFSGELVSFDDLERGGSKIFAFDNVRLAPSEDINDVHSFSSYAFNQDGIKSETTVYRFRYKASIASTQPKAYLISIGVNKHIGSDSWNLKFAVSDAFEMSKNLGQALVGSKVFHKVVPVVLYSKNEEKESPSYSNTATKAHIKAVFNRLAGKPANEKLLREIKGSDQLMRTNPEDLVIITFSGHGYAENNGVFHIFPSDIDGSVSRNITPELLRTTINTNELSKWIIDIDSKEFIFVIDACNSAGSIQGDGFKPGPMGSRGFGQLAYDKGMRVLAASQADDVAIENESLGHGILTYALIKEGIYDLKADRLPKDGVIDVYEWLDWAVKRVPLLYEEIENGEAALHRSGFPPIILDSSDTEILPVIRRVQKPTLFNFARQKNPAVLANVGN